MPSYMMEARHSTGEVHVVHSLETDLWINVIARAMLDLGIQPVGADEKRRKEGEKIRREAANWIFNPHYAEDFELTCQYAGLDPTWVRRIAKTAPDRFAALGLTDKEET